MLLSRWRGYAVPVYCPIQQASRTAKQRTRKEQVQTLSSSLYRSMCTIFRVELFYCTPKSLQAAKRPRQAEMIVHTLPCCRCCPHQHRIQVPKKGSFRWMCHTETRIFPRLDPVGSAFSIEGEKIQSHGIRPGAVSAEDWQPPPQSTEFDSFGWFQTKDTI